MRFDLNVCFSFSADVASIKKDVESFLKGYSKSLAEKDKTISFKKISITGNVLCFDIVSSGVLRPHNVLLNLKNNITREFGKKHHVGVREITVKGYTIEFEVIRKPLKKIVIPFADVFFDGTKVTMVLKQVDEGFLRRNYIDRMISLVKEKVERQYYEGKSEFWKVIWKSEEKKPVWYKDPTEEMIRRGWLQPGPSKGKWFYRPQAAAILKTMKKIAEEEVLLPLGFKEVVESNIVPFDIWLRTGHLEGMPSEFYYVVEPVTRDVEHWERFIDLAKITKEVPFEELKKNVTPPVGGICYAQCPMIYWSFKGKTIAEKSLPVLVYEKTVVSARYESGGRHGIERVDEFHRIEPVYIGTREQLLSLKDKFIQRYKHVFNDIFDLEWRMAWVTPWYMQQAGEIDSEDTHPRDTGTIDFEAYLPYRGSREKGEWLEFQNLSILGDKYVKAFNIKAQKSMLWSGCSGIGLERWVVVFLAQKGLNPDKWPEGFRKYLDKIPEGIEFL
ncbi:MAG: serine--tRNA ligase [Thermoplasmata archaeon]|nr:MAG: serine--tRNA ligase [Thermoplasmata archaeon]